MQKTVPLLLVFGLAAALLPTPGWVARAAAADVDLRIVVHPSNRVSELTRSELSDIFLRKVESWQNQGKIEPIDQATEAVVRGRFSEQVHGRTPHAIRNYWQRQIFSGRGVPPPEASSDREVLEYVRSHPGAIGYVATADGLEGVKLVAISD